MISYRRKLFVDTWPIDEKAGQQPNQWPGWPENKKFALVLSHDVDTQQGHDKCHYLTALEEKLGFRSSFNFVPEKYQVSEKLRETLLKDDFEICVHGLNHDGRLFFSEKIFSERAIRINHYLKDWGVDGFTSPSMHHKFDWMHKLNITHGTSTFDTDPFEPQPDPVSTIFPFWVPGLKEDDGFLELPYTVPQDFTVFILMQEKNINIWKQKLDWIVEKGGMALLNTHPDYMQYQGIKASNETYSYRLYADFLKYILEKYSDQYWLARPKDMYQFYRSHCQKWSHCEKLF